MTSFLPYNPGNLPTRSGPRPGDKIKVKLSGLPPAKRRGASLRNPSHPRYQTFVDLREAAEKEMDGRAWYFGPVKLDLIIRSPQEMKYWEIIEYVGGIMDTLDGSSGVHFTYLPIVYEDDCQVAMGDSRHEFADQESYEIEITFL